MRHVIGLVAGVALLVLGAQGGIRLLVDHRNAGLLDWVPGGFAAQLFSYAVIAATGAALAYWGRRRVDEG